MNHDNTQAHFFAANITTWATTTPTRSLKALLTLMEKEKIPFHLFYVPVAYDVEYHITGFQPQVDGTRFLGFFKGKSK